MYKKSFYLYCILTFSFGILKANFSNPGFQPSDKDFNPSLVLWYDKPATDWTEALPIGNGRLGAMVYGGAEKEIIQFNEETLWTGQPHDYAHNDAHEVLDELRQLLWEGKQREAHKLGNDRFMSQPFGQLNYQPFGKGKIEFPGHNKLNKYRRKLDLENAGTSLFQRPLTQIN